MADTTGLAVALPVTPEPVLLGSAMLGAVAGGAYASLDAAMHAMSKIGEIAAPDAGLSGFHAAKRKVHRLLQVMDRESRAVMKTV
jgi:D-ribulokinase